MNQSEFNILLDKWLGQTASEQETQEFLQFLHNDTHHPVVEEVLDKYFAAPSVDVTSDNEKKEALRKVFDELQLQRTPPIHRVYFLRRWGWAAAILIVLGGGYLFNRNTKKEKPDTAQQTNPAQEIVPGTNKALLTLSDGTTITLDSAANGAIAQQGNSSVIKTASGEIRYDAKGNGQRKLVMNTMTTPRGGQYQLTLPDGSKVWLNAASSITYPADFTGIERRVNISGEAYMEIVKDKFKPFIVDVAGKSAVQVLGTSFNINSYEDEGNIQTTLIDGSVKVNDRIVLKAGQQAVQTGIGEVKVIDADVAQVLAWKNGMFQFNNADVKVVMQQISRWYDVEVVYEDKPARKPIYGEMQRELNLSDVVEILSKLGVPCRVEGRKLIVEGAN